MYERIKVNALPHCDKVLDCYEIDVYGNIYGNNGMEMKSKNNRKGYKQISLKRKDCRKWIHFYVHELVALAFIPNPENLPEINHKDENKANNYYKNLEWCTHKYETKIERMGQTIANYIYVYDFRLNFVGKFLSVSEAERELNIYIRKADSRVKQYYILSEPNLDLILSINKKQKITSVVVTDIFTFEKKYFYSNREARRFFNNEVNITQAIQKNWTVRGRYKIRNLNYKKLIGTLDL